MVGCYLRHHSEHKRRWISVSEVRAAVDPVSIADGRLLLETNAEIAVNLIERADVGSLFHHQPVHADQVEKPNR